MNRWGSVGISTFTFLGILLLLGAGVSSIFLGQSTEVSEEFADVTDDVLNEISTYFIIKNVVGKFDYGNSELQRMVIMVKPLITTTVNLSDMHIQISDGNTLVSLSYNESHAKANGDIFGNQIWGGLDNNEFGILVLTDSDNSIASGYLNDDLVYVALNIPPSLSIRADGHFIVSIIPAQGYVENIFVKTPFILHSGIEFLEYY